MYSRLDWESLAGTREGANRRATLRESLHQLGQVISCFGRLPSRELSSPLPSTCHLLALLVIPHPLGFDTHPVLLNVEYNAAINESASLISSVLPQLYYSRYHES